MLCAYCISVCVCVIDVLRAFPLILVDIAHFRGLVLEALNCEMILTILAFEGPASKVLGKCPTILACSPRNARQGKLHSARPAQTLASETTPENLGTVQDQLRLAIITCFYICLPLPVGNRIRLDQMMISCLNQAETHSFPPCS